MSAPREAAGEDFSGRAAATLTPLLERAKTAVLATHVTPDGDGIGAGAVVPEGTRIPEGSLVLGVPGRVVRPLREEEIARVVRNAASYVDLAAAYRRGEVLVP